MGNGVPQSFATIFPGPKSADGHYLVDQRLTASVRLLENELGVRVFCMVQKSNDNESIDTISPWLHQKILETLHDLPRGTPIAVLLNSPGGDAHSAFKIARAIARHCGEFFVVIPRWAKSAATLLSLGASKIYFGEHAEFGPIDVQIEDYEHERQISALEMVQSLERLNSEAMLAMDAMMSLLLHRSHKRIDSLLPAVLKYATDVTRPIFEKIDTVSFTYHARLLKIGEDYAKLLLRDRYRDAAEAIAITLTRGYPDHGFVIDGEEAARIGLELTEIPDNLREPMGPSLPSYTKNTVLGFLEDVPNEAKTKDTATTSAAPTAEGNSSLPGSTAAPNKPNRRVGNQRRTRNRIGQDGSA